MASLVGREFTSAQLNPIVEEMTEDCLFEILEEAIAARVIEELPRSVGQYQFTHALIHETLAGEMSTTKKVRLHARIAQVMEELYGDDTAAHAAELARHYSEAEAMAGSGKLIHYSLLAGERALGAYAWEEAQAQFERGLAAKDGQQPVDAEKAALLFGLGRAQMATLEREQLRDAVASLSRAFDYYHSADDSAQAVPVAEYPEPFTRRLLNDMAIQLIPRALTLVPPDSDAGGRLLSLYGRLLGIEEGNYDWAQAAFEQALAIAQREQDVRLEMVTLANAARVDSYHVRDQESLEKILRAIDLVGRADDPSTEVAVHFYAGFALRRVDDLDGARRHDALGLEVAERIRDRFWLSRLLRSNFVNALWDGDWEVARELSDRALVGTPLDIPNLSFRAMMEYEVGNFDGGKQFLERLEESTALGASRANEQMSVARAFPVIARITGLHERLEVAEAAAEAILASPDGAAPLNADAARTGLGWLAVVRGDESAAEELHDTLMAASNVQLPPACADRLLGLLSQTTENLDQAAVHFEDALTFCRRAGYRPDLAWTCCDYADTLLEKDGKGDGEKAVQLLDESLTVSSELGMRPLMERVLSRREILKA